MKLCSDALNWDQNQNADTNMYKNRLPRFVYILTSGEQACNH